MTKRDFVQQAIIAMASKVIGTNGVTDGGEWSNIVREADELVKIVEKESNYGYFD